MTMIVIMTLTNIIIMVTTMIMIHVRPRRHRKTKKPKVRHYTRKHTVVLLCFCCTETAERVHNMWASTGKIRLYLFRISKTSKSCQLEDFFEIKNRSRPICFLFAWWSSSQTQVRCSHVPRNHTFNRFFVSGPIQSSFHLNLFFLFFSEYVDPEIVVWEKMRPS